jgi:hypothetical protein
VQNDGRLDALRAELNVCGDIAGGNAIGQRLSNVLGRGIASQTSVAMAVSHKASKGFMTHLLEAGIA